MSEIIKLHTHVREREVIAFPGGWGRVRKAILIKRELAYSIRPQASVESPILKLVFVFLTRPYAPTVFPAGDFVKSFVPYLLAVSAGVDDECDALRKGDVDNKAHCTAV